MNDRRPAGSLLIIWAAISMITAFLLAIGSADVEYRARIAYGMFGAGIGFAVAAAREVWSR